MEHLAGSTQTEMGGGGGGGGERVGWWLGEGVLGKS